MHRSSKLALALLLGAALAAVVLPVHAQSSSSSESGVEEEEETEEWEAEEEELEEGGVYDFTQEDGPGLRIYGKSGKMLIGRGLKPKDDPNHLEVDFYKMTEVDVYGEEVKGGKIKHKFDAFSKVPFAVSNGWEDVEIQDVDFQQVALSAPLVDASGAVTVAVLLAEENGELVYGNDAADCGQEGTDPCKNEVTSIAEGALKFTVTIENWIFCDGHQTYKEAVNYCKDSGDGAYIDFKIKFKGKDKVKRDDLENFPEAEWEEEERQRHLRFLKDGTRSRPRDKNGKRRPQQFDFGGGLRTAFSTKVQVDGEWQDMPDGFPIVDIKDNKAEVVLRLPRGEVIFYDPTIMVDGVADAYTSASATPSPGTALALLGVVAMAVVLRD